MLGVMIALAIITAVLNPLFLGGDNLRNNVRHISLISLFALGEAMVIIAGGIDLSIGSIICITAVTTSYLAMYAGFGIGAAVAIAIGDRAGHAASLQGGDRRAHRRPAVRRHAGLDAAPARRRRGADRRHRRRLPGEVPGLPVRWAKGTALGLPMPFWFAAGGDRHGRLRHAPHAASAAIATRSAPTPEAARLSGVPVVTVRLSTFVAAALLSGVRRHPLRRATCRPRRRRWARRTSCTRSRRRCSAAVRCRAGKGSVFGVVIGAGIMQITSTP